MFVNVSTGVSPAPSTGVLGGSSEDLTGATTGPSGCKFTLLARSVRSACCEALPLGSMLTLLSPLLLQA